MSKFDPAGHNQPRSGHPSLLGKTILVTRARTQSDDITTQLEALGASVIHFPTIEIVPPESWAALDASIARIRDYDWIVFTSANGVNFFLSRLAELQQSNITEVLSSKVICAIGPATARAIEAAGATAHVVASDSRAEGALASIIDHLGGEENIRGLKFLIPRARVARETLPEGLRSLSAHVDAVEAYQTVKPDVDRDAVISLFSQNRIDAIAFTSSSTISNLAELTGLTDLSDLLATTLVVCIGPTTAETAAKHGLNSVIQPSLYNAAALVESIIDEIGEK